MNTDDFTPDAPDEGASTPTDRRPLGAWLRLVDGLITREFAAAFEGEYVSRRDWMILNVISGTVDAPWVAHKLSRGGKHVNRLAEIGWIAQDEDGAWTLTDEGRAAQSRLTEKVDAVRSKVAAAVSPEGYTALTDALEKIAREFGWDESQPMPRRGPGFGRHGLGRPGFGRGFGPGFGRGFGPGYGPGEFAHGDHRAAGAGHDGCHHDHDLEYGHDRGFGPGHRGFGPGHHEYMRAEFEHRHHGRGKGGKHGAERAYERGFAAGFAASGSGAQPAGASESD
ncbi:hypothetical protein [Microbacterium terrisoli]|uniref:hypothetical protein n=1 Tax=Microbacterium terrisoli TaxID=3242192 RepID=UPI0028062A91|nr:hypothetical protein [Microbacterium protaetiae]